MFIPNTNPDLVGTLVTRTGSHPVPIVGWWWNAEERVGEPLIHTTGGLVPLGDLQAGVDTFGSDQ